MVFDVQKRLKRVNKKLDRVEYKTNMNLNFFLMKNQNETN